MEAIVAVLVASAVEVEACVVVADADVVAAD